MLQVSVQGGTHAGWRSVPDLTIDRCACGGFISQKRAATGTSICVMCEHEIAEAEND